MATTTGAPSGGGAVTAPESGHAAALSIEHVTKAFSSRQGTHVVLDDVNLEIRRGEFICLLGPSGCGKSTLLNMIAGFLKPDGGRLTSGGEAIEGPGADRCMLFQSPTLFPWLTAKNNVMYGPRARGDRSSETEARAGEVLEIVGLKGFGDHYPHQLSGGMQHRVALARALVNEPQILLMDEPFSALDAITRTAMREFLLSLWEQQKSTIVFVTHDVDEATLLADRVCVMGRNPGRVAQLLNVELPRPRDVEDVETVAFLEARREIRRALEGAMGTK